jgi:hypothetical protein
MTAMEAKKLRVGSAVKWESSGERGKVTEKGEAGIRVKWDDGTEAIYLYLETAHGLLHVVKT